LAQRGFLVYNRTGYDDICLFTRTSFQHIDPIHDVIVVGTNHGRSGTHLADYATEDMTIVDGSNRLWLRPGNAKGSFGNRTMIGTGLRRVLVVLLDRPPHRGREERPERASDSRGLYQYPGAATGRLGAPVASYDRELSTVA